MPRIGEVIIGVAIAAAIGMIAGAFLFARNQDGDDTDPGLIQTETLSHSFDTSGSPAIVIESWNGPVSVRGVDANTVSVEVVRTGTGATEEEAFDNLTLLEARVTQEGDTVKVNTFRTNDAPGAPGTRAAITVEAPAGSSVQISAGGNGGVTVEGITGGIDVAAEETVVQVALPGDGGFSLDAETANGAINDGYGLAAQPTANGGGGQTLHAEEGSAATEIRLRAGTGITIRRQ